MIAGDVWGMCARVIGSMPTRSQGLGRLLARSTTHSPPREAATACGDFVVSVASNGDAVTTGPAPHKERDSVPCGAEGCPAPRARGPTTREIALSGKAADRAGARLGLLKASGAAKLMLDSGRAELLKLTSLDFVPLLPGHTTSIGVAAGEG